MFNQILFTVFLFSSLIAHSQKNEDIVIPFTRNSANIIEIKTNINGTEQQFIFDTGASTVSFGKDLFNKLLKDSVFTNDDIIAKTNTRLANGSLVYAWQIKIRKIKIGKVLLENIEAIVIDGNNVPPLLGQSVLENFGTITIDNQKNELILKKKSINIQLNTLKLIPCTTSDQEITEKIIADFKTSKNEIYITKIDIEQNTPPQKAIDRLKNQITIRYFDKNDVKKAIHLKTKLLSLNYMVTLEDMQPYYKKPIPDYIEIWIHNNY
ncbi:retropepsin-like aspartic protease [uncultured Kordia sp.]|uniref:retropepsin-like aspartic protease n=1 Tax=uncultured Kordia sp. TaxID=507699 RepID=UPI0026097798|nr:retropepsin-like aspartic protease [uncultured Kordia sp.]